MDTPNEAKKEFLVYGYWHREEGRPYVYEDGKIETHLYDNIDDALAFIKEHSLWNVNITWCLTWDPYEIEKITKYGD